MNARLSVKRRLFSWAKGEKKATQEGQSSPSLKKASSVPIEFTDAETGSQVRGRGARALRLSTQQAESESSKKKVTAQQSESEETESEENAFSSGVWRVRSPQAAPVEDPTRGAIFHAYSPIVRRIALKIARSLPRSMSLDDIISAGWVGMSEALQRRPEGMPEEQFEAYASYRIRGAILDYLRALDPLSRRLRTLARKIQAVTRELTSQLQRVPSQEEIALHLGVSLSQLERTLGEIQEAGAERVDIHTHFELFSTEPSPEALVLQNNLGERIIQELEELPERLQSVLALHYQHECSLREIGELLGVTESRVCQLHAEAVRRIRSQLEGQELPASGRPRLRTVQSESA